MESNSMIAKAEVYLHKLCIEIPSRRVGSEGNRAATDFFAETMRSFGFVVDSPEFDCIDWRQDGASLTVDNHTYEAFPSPYSPGCRIHSPLVVVSTDEELETTEISGRIVLLRGEITREQLMPKNFPFYNPDRHRKIIEILETRKPQAVIAATSRDVVMVGSQYPFPLFEDGDFLVPSVYMTEEEGNRLVEHAGKPVFLESRAIQIPSKGCNVVARKGRYPDRRAALFAHIDARMGSPGAGDNASGIVALLLLSELLSDYTGDLSVEIVAMNGEDYFSNPGEQLYLACNAGSFEQIVLGINLDDVGYHKGKIAYSTYGCPERLETIIENILSTHKGIIRGEAWYQGDHGLFLMNQAPALAFTSELVSELMAEITHTPKDRPELIDLEKLVELALALRELLAEFNLQSRSS